MTRKQYLEELIAHFEEVLRKKNYKPFQFEKLVAEAMLKRWREELAWINAGTICDREFP